MSWEDRLRDLVLAGGVLAAACTGTDMTPCCNANPDPCCGPLYCGGPMTSECRQEQACQAEGGTWEPWYGTGPDGEALAPSCSFPSATDGAEPADAAPGDATTPSFCCNANPDPCCVYLHCGGSLTAECSQELACQADGGTWNPYFVTQPDGAMLTPGCEPSPEAGAHDAGSDDATPGDATPGDAGPDGDAHD
jgi:hypothetical protein